MVRLEPLRSKAGHEANQIRKSVTCEETNEGGR